MLLYPFVVSLPSTFYLLIWTINGLYTMTTRYFYFSMMCIYILVFSISIFQEKLNEQNEQLLFGVEKFTSRYQNMKGSIPLLTSSLNRFGWTFGGSVTSRKGGHLHHGRRISMQATAAGRRKGTKSRGKARVTPGALVKSARGNCEIHDTDSRYRIPTRRPPKGRRPHSLTCNIEKGQQNAGKW